MSEGIVDPYCTRFKLHLRPDHLESDSFKKSDLPPLPPNKTIVGVFADFLSYLFSCARRYISETYSNGDTLWEAVARRIEFVLSHPNGWEGYQQDRMRKAVVMGGLVPNTADGRERIHFVSEGEASLNFCIQSGLIDDKLRVGSVVLQCVWPPADKRHRSVKVS